MEENGSGLILGNIILFTRIDRKTTHPKISEWLVSSAEIRAVHVPCGNK
jgi:hypothetical protein